MENNKTEPILADMHYDGVRFDARILQALKAQRAGIDKQDQSNPDIV